MKIRLDGLVSIDNPFKIVVTPLQVQYYIINFQEPHNKYVREIEMLGELKYPAAHKY